MRLLTLALLGLLPAASPTVATARPEPAHAAAAAKPSGSKASLARSRSGLAQARGGSACSPKARHCGGAGMVRVHFGWTQGLPPAALVQASECPDGTMATLARGHDDVVRCMPI